MLRRSYHKGRFELQYVICFFLVFYTNRLGKGAADIASIIGFFKLLKILDVDHLPWIQASVNRVTTSDNVFSAVGWKISTGPGACGGLQLIDASGFKTWRNEHAVAHMFRNSAVDILSCVPYVSCTIKSEGMYFDLLPTEILNVIVGNLVGEDVLQLSCTSQQLRAICSLRLFRKVRFPYSIRGLDSLRQFLECDASQHVVSLTYVIPELLPPCKPIWW